ncbi:uncharacterized protein [Prorops nasuta]|uniref:uncharacterized protein n=1 Tax=Prorops nasuta TaxID=863751 RepID=UPI0034CD750E
MQKPSLSKSNNIKRNPSHFSRQRSTMSPLDFSHLQNIHGRHGSTSVDSENDYIDLGLEYANYLQAEMEAVLMNEEVKQESDVAISNLAKMSQEYDLVQDKLLAVKNRKTDVINLSNLQNEADKQLAIIQNNSMKINSEAQEILSKLYVSLRDLDVLKCKNVILPTHQEEWYEWRNSVVECKNKLRCVMELIGERGNDYNEIYEKLKGILETFSSIEDQQEMFEKALSDFQVSVLKNASTSLSLSP